MSFILNGQASGDVASVLMANNFQVGALRPYVGADGRTRITVNDGGKPKTIVLNTTATLRKEEWIQFDRAVIKAAKQRLRVVADLRAAGLQYTIPNGLGKTVLEHETQSDIGPATTSMTGVREGPRDRPEYNLRSMPLPIIHKDFSFPVRQLAASREGGSPLDTTMGELAARRVAEEVEKLTLGESSEFQYGGGYVYGLKNFPDALGKSLTAPTGSNGSTTVLEVLAMTKLSMDNGYYGPWMLYYSPAWTEYMGADYSDAKGDDTLKERIARIDGIMDVRQADYLTGTTLLLVQMTPEVARMVMGLDITTVQWETQGGMMLNFKVMTIQVPQVRSDHTNQTGIVVGAP